MNKPLVLIVDADKRRRAALGRSLRRMGLDSRYAPSLAEAKDAVHKERYQLVVLRLHNGDRKTYSFCRRICRADPVITVVALLPKIDIETESRLFDCGVAEVAAGKQANPRTLFKRIRNHLRPSLARLAEQQWLLIRTTWVNCERHEVWCNGRLRHFPSTLATLLQYFLEHRDRTISRKELARTDIWRESVWPSDQGGKAVDMAISKLRKIIESNPRRPQIILSVRGSGFKLAPDI